MTREAERKKFHEEQDAQGGIVPSKLPHGTVLMIETGTFMYQITVDREQGKYIVDTGAPVCRNSKIAASIDSHYAKLKYNIEDWIGRDMRMLLHFVDGANVLTGEVTGATIKTKDYSYDLWT